MAWIGALVSAGVGIAGDVMQGNNASSAASSAANAQLQGQLAAIGSQQQMFNTVQQEYGPQRNLGYGADQLLAQLYGIPNPNAVETSSMYPANANLIPGGGTLNYGYGAGGNFSQGGSSNYGFTPNAGFETGNFGPSGQREYVPPQTTGTNAPSAPSGAGGATAPTYVGGGQIPSTGYGNAITGGYGSSSGYNPTGATPPTTSANGYPNPSNGSQISPFRGGTPVGGTGGSPVSVGPAQSGASAGSGANAPPGPSPYDNSVVGAMSAANPQFSNFYNSPGFQFSLGLGQQAINRNAAAGGNLYTPNTMANLSQYTIGQASGQYNNYVQQLMGLAGLGGSATAGSASSAQQTGNNIAQLQQNSGATNASGILGSAGAWNSAISQGTGQLTNALSQVPFSSFGSGAPSGWSQTAGGDLSYGQQVAAGF